MNELEISEKVLTEISCAAFILPNISYATNSLIIDFVAINLATFSQSSHSMPMIHASGMNNLLKIHSNVMPS